MKRFGLSKSERIKKRNEFRLIYSKGKTVYSSSRKIKAVFYSTCHEGPPEIKVAFAVYRKAGKAFWRNRVKRLLRESYRLNKEILTNNRTLENRMIFIVFSPYFLNQKKNKKPSLNDVSGEFTGLLEKIASGIS